ncbi:MAG TPA: lysophospholipid acyltransferase family protein [Chthoniobacteraceae bacterium]
MRWLVYMISRFLSGVIFAPFVKLHVRGAENTARPGPFILASNHSSHFDPPLLTVATRRKVDWMAMQALFDMRGVGVWLRNCDGFPVNMGQVDMAASRTAIKRLRLGRMVGIFPEGGIRDGARSALEGGPLRPGLGAIAQLGGAAIIPCAIVGADRLYSGRAWRLWKRTPVWIVYGEPLTCAKGGDRVAIEAALAESFRGLVARLRSECGVADDDLPKSPAFRRSQA